MFLTYFGHACFQVEGSNGLSVVMDPYNDRVGYPLPQAYADVVTMSHQHGDHNHIGKLTGPCQVIDAEGVYHFDGLQIRSVLTDHDDQHGEKRGKNIVFVFEIDGIIIAHAGDLGHMLTQSQIEQIGKVDVLLLPVGGFYTIDAQMAWQVTDALSPRLTIPMHYKTINESSPISDENGFVSRAKNARRSESNRVEITRDTLANMPDVLVLAYA